jgi:hypothetical protein
MLIYYKVIDSNIEQSSILSMVLPDRSTLKDFLMIFEAGLTSNSKVSDMTILVNDKNVLSSSKLKNEDIVYIYLNRETDKDLMD